jgi:plastocyanin
MRFSRTFYGKITTFFAATFFSALTQAATIEGIIKFEGQAPKMKELAMDADPVCAALHKTPIVSESLVLGEGQTMANVLVYVKNVPAGTTLTVPTEPAVLDQAGCKYAPHVLAIVAGQEVKFLNPDGTLHNVHSLSKENPEFNVAMPKFKKETSKKFEKSEAPFAIKCDVHPWMNAWVAVFDHAFFSVTKEDGKFSLSGLPAGTYSIEAWHEKLGIQSASVTVGADETKAQDFKFAKPTA